MMRRMTVSLMYLLALAAGAAALDSEEVVSCKDSLFVQGAKFTDTVDYLELAEQAELPTDAALFNPEQNITIFMPDDELMLEVADDQAKALGMTYDEMVEDKDAVLELLKHFVVEGTVEPDKPFKTMAGAEDDEEWVWKKTTDEESDEELDVIMLVGSDDPVYYILNKEDVKKPIEATECSEEEESDDTDTSDEDTESDDSDADETKDTKEGERRRRRHRQLMQISSTGSIFNSYGQNFHRRAYRMSKGSGRYKF